MTAEVLATPIATRAIGSHLDRQDGPEKVRGEAAYAVEHGADDGVVEPLTAWLVQATIAKGRVAAVDRTAALAHPGVVAVVDHTDAPRLADTSDGELAILQDDHVGYRGQIVAVVLAETAEAAREGARLVEVTYDAADHRVDFTLDSEVYAPDTVNPDYDTDTEIGDVDRALADAAAVVVDQTYATPHMHNNPMEPHAVTARWRAAGEGPVLDLWDSTQGVHPVAETLSGIFGLDKSQVRVRAPYVGGGFGSKGLPHSPEVAAAMAAQVAAGRPVRLAVTRQQMFALCGYRTATFSRLRLGAGGDGRLVGLEHAATTQTSAVKEFAEQVALSSRVMYAAPDRRTTHRVAELDVAVPSWMRAPGEMPGVYAHEVAMDELAWACGVDPIELRVRNEPDVDPELGTPFNDRRYLECLRRGAERFGWVADAFETRATRDGDWWVGQGVAGATYPVNVMPGNSARVEACEGGAYAVGIGAVDIGTGARTALKQVAADALGVDPSLVDLQLGDTTLPTATVAGGSAGTSMWGTAIVAAAQQFRADHGSDPAVGVHTLADAADYADPEAMSLHSYGAIFAEVRVHAWTGEVRVPRLLGVYSVGRIVNPMTARSQLLGGLVMGMSVALFEESYRDARYGHVVTQDLATYHIASHADVLGVEAEWLEESDELTTPMGIRGLGEIGIVGTAAAIANATHHATGVRVRELPLTPDHFLGG